MVPPMEVRWPTCYSSFSIDLSQCSVLKQAYRA
jgi:hypothetical protein